MTSIKRILYISKSIDPHFNLAFENWLLQDRHKTSNEPDCLFIYRNKPSIIIGRNQNVWAECNVKEIQSKGISIIRRYSGGGTVYHDLGNVNYSLHRDKSNFNRTFGAEMIIKALNSHYRTQSLYLSPRHDIFLKISNGNSAKVSGSAYKLSRERAYHHGTLLLSSDLEKISNLLKSPLKFVKDENFKFGGISSVPSPVANIPNSLSFDKFLQLIQEEFKPTEPVIEISTEIKIPEIEKYKNELESWNWTFGRSPPFKIALNDGNELLIEDGCVKESLKDSELIGKPFDNVTLC